MTVDDYINQQTPDHQRILRWLRQLILTSDPAIRETIRWNIPFYTYHKRHLYYLNVVRTEPVAVDLAFVHGTGRRGQSARKPGPENDKITRVPDRK